MGYFSNGSEGDAYEAKWCARCIHQGDEDGPGCAVMAAHMLHNYKECNNKESILHILIPRNEGGIGNGQCAMFSVKSDVSEPKLAKAREALKAVTASPHFPYMAKFYKDAVNKALEEAK